MLPFLFGLVFVALIGSGVYFYAKKFLKSNDELLADLGLLHDKANADTAPFYKWGWQKAMDERVWGERIVRKAFEKSQVWLSPDDLLYFKSICDQYAGGKTVKEEEIHNRIGKILARKGTLTNCATKHIQKIVKGLLSISDAEALKILRGLGLKSEESNARRKLGIVQLRKMLNTVGEQILSLNAKGFDIKDDNDETLFTLHGFDGWSHWLRACKEEMNRISKMRSATPVEHNLLLYLEKNASANVLKEFEQDLKSSKEFMTAMEAILEQKEIKIEHNQIVRLEKILYQWHFTNGIPFTFEDHFLFRDLLKMQSIASRFREIIITSIRPSFSSYQSLLKIFPKRVIFYGSNAYARAYASQRYLAHFEILLKAYHPSKGKSRNPPAILFVTESDIERVRNRQSEVIVEESSLEGSNGEKSSGDYLSNLIEEQKRYSISERGINDRVADSAGWIIDMGVSDFTIQEYAYLDSGPCRDFIRISCEEYKDVDFQSNGNFANKQKTEFFNYVLDLLTQTPALSKPQTDAVLSE